MERGLQIMDGKSKKAHPLRTVLLILLAIIILALALPFIYSLVAGFSDYDDIPALIAADGVRPVSVDENAVLTFSADKSAVYAYAWRQDPDSQISELIQELELPFLSENSVRISGFGYHIGGGAASASAKLKLFGLIPVQLHAEADVRLSPDEIELRLKELKYGRWISLPLDTLAVDYNLPELTDGVILDSSEFFGELYPVGLSAEDDVLVLSCNILNTTAEKIGESGVLLAKLVPGICGADTDAAKLLRGELSDVRGNITDSAALSGLLTELLKFASEENASKLKASLEDSPFINIAIGDVSVCASGYTAGLSEKLSVYEAGLVSLRNNYKEMNYHISRTGLCSADGSPAEAVLPEAWGAKTVLQYNMNYNSIVNANDGSFSPSVGWVVLPNPKLSDLKRDAGAVLPRVSGISVFDLTLAFRLADGTPAIMFLNALDELGINIISEELYDEILSFSGLPAYCSSDIISPTVCRFATPEASQRDLVFYLP